MASTIRRLLRPFCDFRAYLPFRFAMMPLPGTMNRSIIPAFCGMSQSMKDAGSGSRKLPGFPYQELQSS
jgi:hypothetical protein